MTTKVKIYKLNGLETENKDKNDIALNALGLNISFNPFQLMTDNIESIAKELCPRRENYKNYRTNSIPVEVLDLVAETEKNKTFGRMEVWYDDKSPDPFLIGIKQVWGTHVKNKSFHEDNARFDHKEDCERYIQEKGYENCEAYELSWENKKYLMAKWGDEIYSFVDMAVTAKRKFLARTKYELTKLLTETQGKLTLLDLEADNKFYI